MKYVAGGQPQLEVYDEVGRGKGGGAWLLQMHIERLSGSRRHALTALRPSTKHSLPPPARPRPMGHSN